MNEEKIKIRVDLPRHSEVSGESLWADIVKDNYYEIKNIPVFAYGINYMDVVEVVDNSDGVKEVLRVVKRSGHQTVRIRFIDKKTEEENYQRLLNIKGEGVGSEKWNSNMYALNVTPERDYDKFLDELDLLERQKILEYEAAGEWEGSFDGSDPEELLH